MGNNNPEFLAAICNSISDCEGFDTLGYLKSYAGKLTPNSESSFYSKMNGKQNQILYFIKL